jgi:hypothetical protein
MLECGKMRLLRQRSYYREMRGRFAYDTQAMRSPSRRRTHIMVSRMPGEGKGDTSSESGQVNATEVIPNIRRSNRRLSLDRGVKQIFRRISPFSDGIDAD